VKKLIKNLSILFGKIEINKIN